MNRLCIVLTIGLAANSLGHPHREVGNHGGSSSDYQHSGLSGGGIGGGIGHGDKHELSSNYGHGQSGNSGHGQGGSIGHGQGGSIGHGQGGLGHGSNYGGGSQHQQQEFGSGSHGGNSGTSVTSGFSKKRVEGFDSGSSSGYQQGNGYGSGSSLHGSGLNGGGLNGGGLNGGGLNGGGLHQSGGSSSQYGSQSGRQKGFVAEESSGFTSVDRNQGGFQNNKHGSSTGGSYGSHGSRN